MAKRPRQKQKQNRPTPGRTRPMVDVLSPRLEAAQELQRHGRRREAFHAYEKVMRQEADNVRAYVLAARAHAEAFDFKGMEAIHRRLLKRAPSHPGVHHLIGETFEELKLPAQAIRSYEEAVGLPGTMPTTWTNLASLYEQSHRLDEAEAMIQRVAGAGFRHPLPFLVQARIQRRLGQPDAAEATLRDLIGKVPEGDQWGGEAWAEIALLRDKAGDYEGAMDAITSCKSGQKTHEGKLYAISNHLHEALDELSREVRAEHVTAWRREAEAWAPLSLALLTGFPRSGTTLLEQVLDAHPGLISSEERPYISSALLTELRSGREDGSWLEVLESLDGTESQAMRARYLPAMAYMLGEDIAGRMHLDKNPPYNWMIPFFLRVFPETRYILAIRDPRDVVLSCFLRYLPLNGVSVHFLDLERTAARYAADMDVWLRLREVIPDGWCEVRYEDSVRDFESQAQRALAALDLEWDDRVLAYRERLGREKQVTSPTYEAVAQPIHTGAIGRWRNYARHFEPVLDRLRPYVEAFGYDV